MTVASPVIIAQVLGRATFAGMTGGRAHVSGPSWLFHGSFGDCLGQRQKAVGARQRETRSAEQFAAAQVGDLVGDPFKDACGPSVMVLVRLMAITALIISPLLR